MVAECHCIILLLVAEFVSITLLTVT